MRWICLAALFLCGCTDMVRPGSVPTKAQIDALKCKRQVREVASMIASSPDLKPYAPVQNFCPVGKANTLVFEPAADHKSFVLYCKGEHHVAGGCDKDYPRFTTARGMEMRAGQGETLPAGFPLPKLPYDKLVSVVASQEGSLTIEMTYQLEKEMVDQLNAVLKDPITRKDTFVWFDKEIPGADKLSVTLETNRKLCHISYFPSHLAD